MKAWITTVLVGLLAVAAGPVALAGQQEVPTMRVLVLTGEDNAHDWEANSDRIMELWEDWGVTDVERQAMTSEEAWVEWDGDYADYDAVVHMYYTPGRTDRGSRGLRGQRGRARRRALRPRGTSGTRSVR